MFEYFHLLLHAMKLSNHKLNILLQFRKTGLLYAGPVTHLELDATEKALKKFNVPHKVLDPHVLRREYPMLTFDDATKAVYDESGGVLHADRILQAYQVNIVY